MNDVTKEKIDQRVLVRGRLHTSRGAGREPSFCVRNVQLSTKSLIFIQSYGMFKELNFKRLLLMERLSLISD